MQFLKKYSKAGFVIVSEAFNDYKCTWIVLYSWKWLMYLENLFDAEIVDKKAKITADTLVEMVSMLEYGHKTLNMN